MSAAETKLQSLGITLPEAPMPAALCPLCYYKRSGVYFQPAASFVDGKMAHTGHVEKVITTKLTEQARICAINLIAQLKAACGGDLGLGEANE